MNNKLFPDASTNLGNLKIVFLFLFQKTRYSSSDGNKSPGLAGVNFHFIKQFWDLLDGDLTTFLDDFQKNGRLVRGCNSSFVVLIPKRKILRVLEITDQFL